MRTRNLYPLSLVLAAGFIVALNAGAENVQFNSPSLSNSTVHTYGEQQGDLPNFHEVHSFLYRGGRPTEEGLKKLKAMGVKTIIDLRASSQEVEPEAAIAKRLGFRTINLPMTAQPPTPKEIHSFITTVEEAKSSDSSVFVHCMHGSDRTGCIVGIWRVTHDGWDYDRAYQEMRKYYFSPKFTLLSDTVRQCASRQTEAATK